MPDDSGGSRTAQGVDPKCLACLYPGIVRRSPPVMTLSRTSGAPEVGAVRGFVCPGYGG